MTGVIITLLAMVGLGLLAWIPVLTGHARRDSPLAGLALILVAGGLFLLTLTGFILWVHTTVIPR